MQTFVESSIFSHRNEIGKINKEIVSSPLCGLGLGNSLAYVIFDHTRVLCLIVLFVRSLLYQNIN